MPKLINADAAFAEIGQVIKGCTARHFHDSRDTAVALEMLKRCAQIIIMAPEEGRAVVGRCAGCKHWGRIHTQADSETVKMCAVGGYMVNGDGYCHFREGD